MFEGGFFGVGLTVNQLAVPGGPGGAADPDWHPTRLGELMPVATRSDAGLAEEMRRANIADSKLWAYRVELIVELAYRRRDDRDRAAGTPGSASPRWAGPGTFPKGLSEFLPDEVAMVMNCSRAEATMLTTVAWTLIHSLPATWAALADGELNWSVPGRSPRRSADTARSSMRTSLAPWKRSSCHGPLSCPSAG